MRGPLSEGRLEEVGASPVPTASEAESTTYHKPRLISAKRKNRNAHEEAKQESTKADAQTGLAVEIADEPRKGGENPTLTREEEEEEVRCLIIKRADAFTDAYTHIEDLPNDQIGEKRRVNILATLSEESERASQEAGRYKQDLGFPTK